MGSTKNAKKAKAATNEEAAKRIAEKQSQKRKQGKRKEEQKQRNEAEIKEREQRKKQKRQERIKEREQQRIGENKNEIKTKREERKDFLAKLAKLAAAIPDTGRVINRDQRIIADRADQKRREEYLKYVKHQPKFEEDFLSK